MGTTEGKWRGQVRSRRHALLQRCRVVSYRLGDQETLCKEYTGLSTVLDTCMTALRMRRKNLD